MSDLHGKKGGTCRDSPRRHVGERAEPGIPLDIVRRIVHVAHDLLHKRRGFGFAAEVCSRTVFYTSNLSKNMLGDMCGLAQLPLQALTSVTQSGLPKADISFCKRDIDQ